MKWIILILTVALISGIMSMFGEWQRQKIGAPMKAIQISLNEAALKTLVAGGEVQYVTGIGQPIANLILKDVGFDRMEAAIERAKKPDKQYKNIKINYETDEVIVHD